MTRKKEEDDRRAQKAGQPFASLGVQSGGWPASVWAGGQTPTDETPATPATDETPVTPPVVQDGGWPKAAPVLREGQTPGGWPTKGDPTPTLPFGGTPKGWGELPTPNSKAAWSSTLKDAPWVGGRTPATEETPATSVTPATGRLDFGGTPRGWLPLPELSKKVTGPNGSITPTPKSPTGRGGQGHGGRQ